MMISGWKVVKATTEGKRYFRNGNVGMGKSSTSSRLDVLGEFRISGASSGYVGFTVPAAAGTTTYTLPTSASTNGQVLTTNGSGTLSWTTVSGGSSQWTTNGSSVYYNSGNVGIGTTGPGDLFTVYRAGQGNTGLTVNSDTGTWISVLANRGAGGSNPLTQAGDATIIYGVGSNAGALTIGQWSTSARGIRIDASGDVGVGKASPGSRLDILGEFRINGATSGYVGFAVPASAGTTTYSLPTIAGSNGQVLTTNGSGGLSWTTVSGGGSSFASITVTNDASISGLTVGKGGGANTSNIAVGSASLVSNSSGVNNSAFGFALYSNTTGSGNTGMGNSAL